MLQRKVSPLHESSYRGYIKLVKLLLDEGAAVDATDKDGWTPLHAACRQGNIDIVLLLIEANANTGHRSRAGKLPRDYAVDQGCTRIVELLDTVSAGGDLRLFSASASARDGTSESKANAGPTSQHQTLADIQRMMQNDPSLTEVVWSGLTGVDTGVLCSLADALPANSCVRRLDFTGVKAMNDTAAARIGASVPYCVVNSIKLDGTAVSHGKQLDLHRLCLMNEVREVAANQTQRTEINWKGRYADDGTLSALANALQGNHHVSLLDLSNNPDLHDRSIRRIVDVLSKSAVQKLRIIGTGITSDVVSEVVHLCALANVTVVVAEDPTTTALPNMQALSLESPVASKSLLEPSFGVRPGSPPMNQHRQPIDYSPAVSQPSQPIGTGSFEQPATISKPEVGAIGETAAPIKANSRLFGWVSAPANVQVNGDSPDQAANMWMPDLGLNPSLMSAPTHDLWEQSSSGSASMGGSGGSAFGALALDSTATSQVQQAPYSNIPLNGMPTNTNWPVKSVGPPYHHHHQQQQSQNFSAAGQAWEHQQQRLKHLEEGSHVQQQYQQQLQPQRYESQAHLPAAGPGSQAIPSHATSQHHQQPQSQQQQQQQQQQQSQQYRPQHQAGQQRYHQRMQQQQQRQQQQQQRHIPVRAWENTDAGHVSRR